MDMSTSWILFVLTLLIYLGTITSLHTIAEKFRLRMNTPDIQIIRGVQHASSANNVTTPTPEGIYNAPAVLNRAPSFSKLYLNSTGGYRELHETLDVSIFR